MVRRACTELAQDDESENDAELMGHEVQLRTKDALWGLAVTGLMLASTPS